MTLTVYLRHAVKKITAKTGIIDQPRFHANMQNTSQKCPLISSLTPLFDSTNYLALFRSYQRAIIHCQTFSVARGERNAHFLVLAPRLLHFSKTSPTYGGAYSKSTVFVYPPKRGEIGRFSLRLARFHLGPL